MLVFVDESGDAGRKTQAGSSPYFVVSTTVFTDRTVAQECDDGIGHLRTTLGFKPHKEFHFNKDNDETKRRFLDHVSGYDFFYSALVLNKERLTGPGFQYTDSLYKFTVKLAFQNILPDLKDAIVVFDRCGSREFTKQLRNYVRKHTTNDGAAKPIKRIRCDNSHGNNLLQMADMVCGAIAKCYSCDHPGRASYRTLIRGRERRVQVWPQ